MSYSGVSDLLKAIEDEDTRKEVKRRKYYRETEFVEVYTQYGRASVKREDISAIVPYMEGHKFYAELYLCGGQTIKTKTLYNNFKLYEEERK